MEWLIYMEDRMRKGFVEVYCGNGKGKTSMALGQSLKACAEHKSVIIIQFLKGKENGELNFLEAYDIKLFRFEKSNRYYNELNSKEQEEQRQNIRNGLNYARKVIATSECDLLVLDEILGLPDLNIATWEEIREILRGRGHNEMHIILTGHRICDELKAEVDTLTSVETEYLTSRENSLTSKGNDAIV
jgi:cob(I)alamin adenosyltransferase